MSRAPRILSIITRLNVGGASAHVMTADQGLRALGWNSLVAFGEVQPDEIEIDLEDVDTPLARIAGLARPVRPGADLRAAAEIARLIRRHRPDVIHTHLSKAGLLGRVVAMTTSRAIRVHTFHGTIFGGYFGARTSRAIVRAERFLGWRTHAVIAISPRQRQELLENRIAPDRAIHVVPYGMSLERFAAAASGTARAAARRRLDIPPGAYAIVAIGRLVEIKRLDRMIDAFALLAQRMPGARLYLVGDGASRAALEARAAAAGQGHRVSFVGWSLDTPDWYAAADVVALTSDREGTPLALIEAAAAGRAAVATDVGGVADVVRDGQTGFVVGADDIQGFADRLLRLGTDSKLRAAMGAAAPAEARQYSAERLAVDLDRLYRAVLAASRGHS